MGKHWYKEKKIVTDFKNFPKKRVVYVIGSGVAKIVIGFDDFIKKYDEELEFGKKWDGLKSTKIADEIRDQIKIIDEVDIREAADRVCAPLDSSYYFRRTRTGLIEDRKVFVYDMSDNKYVDYYSVIDCGTVYSPLSGWSSKTYKLPNGKVFYETSWIS